MKRGSLGLSSVSAYWPVEVFWSYRIIDRSSDHLYVSNIPLFGCVNRCSRYTVLVLGVDIFQVHRGVCLIVATTIASKYKSTYVGVLAFTIENEYTLDIIDDNSILSLDHILIDVCHLVNLQSDVCLNPWSQG